MTNDELYEIVKDHTDAWPEDVRDHPSGFLLKHDGDGEPGTHEFVMPDKHALLAFEASFHRALMARGDDRGDVYASHFRGTYTVQIDDHDFYAPTLIEAYAKALEWLK